MRQNEIQALSTGPFSSSSNYVKAITLFRISKIFYSLLFILNQLEKLACNKFIILMISPTAQLFVDKYFVSAIFLVDNWLTTGNIPR